MSKNKKVVSIVAVVLALFSCLSVVGFAITWNASSNSVSGGSSAAKASATYWVQHGSESDCLGYRFSIVDANGCTVTR